METEYIEDGRNRFLRLRSSQDYESKYEIRMIHNNQPQGLLHMHITEGTGETFFDYSISGLSSLKDLENAKEADYLYSVIFSMEQLSNVLFEFLLSPDKILLDPELIFLKKETGNVYFCYYPGKESTFQEALQALIEFFLKVLNPKDEEKVLLIYGLYQKAREKNVTMKTLAEFWREHMMKYHSGAETKSSYEKTEPEAEYYVRDEAGTGYGVHREVVEPGKEERLYMDLGLEKSAGDDAFSRWRELKKEKRSGRETDVIETEVREVVYREAEVPREKNLFRKLRPYLFEIITAAIAAAAILIYLFA